MPSFHTVATVTIILVLQPNGRPLKKLAEQTGNSVIENQVHSSQTQARKQLWPYGNQALRMESPGVIKVCNHLYMHSSPISLLYIDSILL